MVKASNGALRVLVTYPDCNCPIVKEVDLVYTRMDTSGEVFTLAILLDGTVVASEHHYDINGEYVDTIWRPCGFMYD